MTKHPYAPASGLSDAVQLYKSVGHASHSSTLPFQHRRNMAPLQFSGRGPVIPPDSLILVTGANGFIASHVCDQLLKAGYRVRGTVRDASKATWLHQLFDQRYGKNRFESALVDDLAKEGAFDDACKGVKGVCHVASVVSGSPDPNAVIAPVVAGAKNTAASAAREPGITRFVYTSSSMAITAPKPNKKFTISTKDWNDESVEEAWRPPPYTVERSFTVYGASKTQAEKALWEFMQVHKPGFTLNAVLPNANFGPLLNNKVATSTAEWVRTLYRGDLDRVKAIPPMWMVNVQDTARLHVAALLAPDLQNKRILAFAQPYNWNDVLAVLRKSFPEKNFVEDDPSIGRDLSELDNSQETELLRAFGTNGFTGLEESVKENCEDM